VVWYSSVVFTGTGVAALLLAAAYLYCLFRAVGGQNHFRDKFRVTVPMQRGVR